jgi:AcrR family transcriptional regulator
MFLERGFDAVRVAEIARECGVSETTVFNYFSTKESLLLDRLDSTAAAVVEAIADTDRDPVAAVVDALSAQLRVLIMGSGQNGAEGHLESFHRFGELIRSTPSLRAHLSERKDVYTATASATLATRYGIDPHDARIEIAAIALVGLWQIQSESFFLATSGKRSPEEVRETVDADLRAAAGVISEGLASVSLLVSRVD